MIGIGLQNYIGLGARSDAPAASPPPTLDELYLAGRDSFGTQVPDATTTILGTVLSLQTADMVAYSDGTLFRATIEKDEVATGDSAGTERCEVESTPTLFFTIGSKSWMGVEFEAYIPAGVPVPGGTSSVVIAQMKFTTGDAIQILHHASGVIRLRRGTGGTNQLVASGSARGQWHKFKILGRWAKDTDGQLVVSVDDADVVTLANAANVYPVSIADSERVYVKLGAYRASGLTDESRGPVSVFFRNITILTEAP